MSELQLILTAIADEMHNGTIEASDLLRLVAAMSGIPEYYHAAMVKAALFAKVVKSGEGKEDKDAE